MKPDRPQFWRGAGIALSFGTTLLGGMLFGYYVGHYVDARMGTDRVWSIVGVMAGVAAAFNMLIRELRKAISKEPKDR